MTQPAPPELAGRHALVCGASSGIGRASALALAARGAQMTVLARRREELDRLVSDLLDEGAGDADALPCDLEDRAALDEAVERALGTKGTVHVLVNNSGGPPSGPILEATDDDFLKPLRRHLLASHRLVQAVVPGMRDAGWGRVVNIISTSVYEPIPGLGVSNTVRAAMAGWAKSVSMELPPGVTINNVLPGYTDTERLGELAKAKAERTAGDIEDIYESWRGASPEHRLARPEEVAAAVAWLASDAASFVRGVSLPVDGGRMHKI